MDTQEHNCIICKDVSHSLLYKNEKVRYVLCEQCALVSLLPRPTEEEYEAFYKKAYQEHRHAITNYEQAIAIREQRGLLGKQHYVEDLCPFVTKESRVFEVGSGWGTFLKLLQNTYGAEVEGIEPAQLTSQVARDYYNLPISTATLGEYVKTHQEKKFDVVVMMHVLEHFVDPLEALQQAHTLLSENGVLYIAVPNIAQPNEPLDRYFHFEHTYYFSPATLLKLLEKAGFTVIWNKNTHEIKMIATVDSSQEAMLTEGSFGEVYSGSRIKKIIRKQGRKYKTLRFVKKIARSILPPQVVRVLRSWVVWALKKIGIIQI